MAVNTKVARWIRKFADWLSPVNSLDGQVRVLLKHPHYQPLLRAIRKTNADKGLQDASSDQKWTETVEWLGHFSNRNPMSDSWKTRFLIELLVGIEKGKLKL